MKEPPGDRKRASGPGGWWSPELGPFLTLGLQLAIAVVVFLFLGRWLDQKFGTTPWLTLAGAAIGIAGGLIKFLRTALRLGKDADREMHKRREKGTRED
jgi:F0F1-type ATP synthase assembly protein I